MKVDLAASDWASARGEKWCAQVSGMESTLAPVDDPLVRALRLDAPYRIAEIGCGGGGTTLEIARRAPAGSVVHGFDIAPSLVAFARARATPDERRVVFALADMATAAPEQPYDRLVSRFGVMFFDEPSEAFTNLARWLAPGGRFGFAVWGLTSENPWTASVRDVVASVIDLPKADPEAPGPFRYADASALVALLDRAGFADIDVDDWHGSLPLGGRLSAADAATFALAAFSSYAELLASAGDGAIAKAHRSLTKLFANHEKDGAVHMAASVHIVTGRRPA